MAVGNGNGNVIRPDFFPFFRRVGTFHHFYFDVVIPTSLGAKIFSNVATNILTLTAVLMGLRNIGNFFCHVCSIQRTLSRNRAYDASSMLYSPNFLPRRGCSYPIWRALNKRGTAQKKGLISHFVCGLRYHATIAEKSSGCQ